MRVPEKTARVPDTVNLLDMTSLLIFKVVEVMKNDKF
jgi:hypothetical protein